MRIVIVDDEAIIVRGLAKLIARAGESFQVVGSFTHSKEALEFIQNQSVDVLITDICMPEIDGLSLISQAKESKRDLHCIILTGYNDFDYARSAIKLGAVDYLLKPIDDRELSDTLSRIASEGPGHMLEDEYSCANMSREVSFLKKEIEENYASFDLNACAYKMGKSREYLCKLYKKETGVNLPDYLKQIRMERAKGLLESIDGYRVYEICELVGYSDPVYFAKQFKKYTGMTPKDFQRYGQRKLNSCCDSVDEK